MITFIEVTSKVNPPQDHKGEALPELIKVGNKKCC